MTESQCESVRTSIPDYAAGRLGVDRVTEVERHVSSCSECGAELELVRLLFAGRPATPDALFGAIVDAVRQDRVYARRPWWGLSAAAVAALALGIGITSDRATPLPEVTPDFASGLQDGELWLSDDGLLAGAPSIDGLSDEALRALLDELSGSAGGAA